ncbi:MAG: malto-oligosyltrehalose trehalohydrolase [Pseudomonadota bacterium]
MRRAHAMPFGAAPRADGGVAFRFWAPSVPQVMLRVENHAPAEFPMLRHADGWHTRDITTPGTAGPGTRYRFLLPDGMLVPDPASRSNPDGVHAASEVVAPEAFDWPEATEGAWRGRPWEEAVIYELHVGTFTPTGDFAGVAARLDHLVDLGVTALEIMPVAAFPGARNWGYDGVLPFAPAACYGRPEDFKRLVAAAHARGLMVFLDVVYNHFGPEGNYLHCYCPEFFNPAHHTPWGAAINFDGARSRVVRDFFIHNALYWIEEYRLDGLRLDAIHAIRDDGAPDIVAAIRAAIGRGPGRERHVHLILENDRNQARYLAPAESQSWRHGVAQWNDDIHHALHVIATGETDGYYADFVDDPVAHLARCLAEGFAWQGEPSPFRAGERRGEPSAHLPPSAFVAFLQTHDQIGNRAFGERLSQLAPPAALRAVTALLLLAPQPPMLFMGEEFAAASPFLFFCDFGPDLAQAVTDGRRREFAGFARFADPAARARIPDPGAPETFAASRLDWSAPERAPHREMLALHRALLALRRREIAPRLAGMGGGARAERFGAMALRVVWTLGDGSALTLTANLGASPVAGVPAATGRLLHAQPPNMDMDTDADALPPWSVRWQLHEARQRAGLP